ncbi:hypothetical protein VP01_336g1 [Puccinia sorghi]|uniref:Uncharacterized protein n=1 Tax=Puccinia sorghi TaxID=27349 RepID=A0A0L6UWU5_9BASI|nr:hypothetical protein VP01_336g1 [Puccinia sorghi]
MFQDQIEVFHSQCRSALPGFDLELLIFQQYDMCEFNVVAARYEPADELEFPPFFFFEPIRLARYEGAKDWRRCLLMPIRQCLPCREGVSELRRHMTYHHKIVILSLVHVHHGHTSQGFQAARIRTSPDVDLCFFHSDRTKVECTPVSDFSFYFPVESMPALCFFFRFLTCARDITGRLPHPMFFDLNRSHLGRDIKHGVHPLSHISFFGHHDLRYSNEEGNKLPGIYIVRGIQWVADVCQFFMNGGAGGKEEESGKVSGQEFQGMCCGQDQRTETDFFLRLGFKDMFLFYTNFFFCIKITISSTHASFGTTCISVNERKRVTVCEYVE